MMGDVMISTSARPEILHVSVMAVVDMSFSFINIDNNPHQRNCRPSGLQRRTGVFAAESSEQIMGLLQKQTAESLSGSGYLSLNFYVIYLF